MKYFILIISILVLFGCMAEDDETENTEVTYVAEETTPQVLECVIVDDELVCNLVPGDE